MPYAFKFVISYTASIFAATVVLVLIGYSLLGSDPVTYSLGILGAAVTVIAILALLPAILLVWLETLQEPRLSILRSGFWGLIVGLTESTVFMLVVANGDLVSGFGYILMFTAIGIIAGASFALCWNSLPKAHSKLSG
jgi:hypothetical protein